MRPIYCLLPLLFIAMTANGWSTDTDPNSPENVKIEQQLEAFDKEQSAKTLQSQEKAKGEVYTAPTQQDDASDYIEVERKHHIGCNVNYRLPGYDEHTLQHRGDRAWFYTHQNSYMYYMSDYKKIHLKSLNNDCAGDVYTPQGKIAPHPKDLGSNNTFWDSNTAM